MSYDFSGALMRGIDDYWEQRSREEEPEPVSDDGPFSEDFQRDWIDPDRERVDILFPVLPF